MCSELGKDFYVVYQLEMVAGEVENSCQLVVTFFFFFFGLTLPNYRNKSGSAQRSPPSYQLLPPPLLWITNFLIRGSFLVSLLIRQLIAWAADNCTMFVTAFQPNFFMKNQAK